MTRTDLLSLERMRQDIADVLEIDPAGIGDEDDLLDHGLDSMRLMTLALRWNEAGARLGFADLAERPHLRWWWELASRTDAQPDR